MECNAIVVNHVENRYNSEGQKITANLLSNECKYLQNGNNWFVVSEIQHFNPQNFYLNDTITDPFGNVTTIQYDIYSLFPVTVTDALEFETTAQYNYRVLQAQKQTDPNGNSKELEFNTLGMVVKLAVMGKNGEGDTLSEPTEIYGYNLYHWQEFQKPVYAYIAKRETHADSNTRWLESYVYTDGLGNEIMTKTTAADGEACILDPITGIVSRVATNNRWLCSGKTIYNNKNLPVKQYEPWYSDTHEFTFEDELTHYGVTPIMRYDPLGRLIQTDFPDGTTTRVAFDAWQQKNYDQNDNNPSSPHYNTPQIIDLDVLGRPFKTTDSINSHASRVTCHELDITGRILKTTDALGRVATQNIYALSEKHLLSVHNIDSGERWLLNDTAGKPAKKWDSRNHEFTFNYDALQRHTETKVNNAYVECLIYGEDEQENNIGKIIAAYAQDGITSFEYDFKGNIIFSRKQFTANYNMATNWEDDIELLPEEFTAQTAYDALNRPISIINPDNTTVSYQYDKGGLLQKVLKDEVEQVTNITYNPKGQRENIYYGNNTKTRYYYNPLNFRLTRILTTRNAGQDVLQDLNYTFDSVGNITQITDDAQQTHYFNNQVVAATSNFEYDALYRLINATGRELTVLTAPTHNDFVNNIYCPNPVANAMQNYNHSYSYDVLGNILQDAWKSYQYASVNNYLLGNNNVANQYTYDQHGNMLTMPHLSAMIWNYKDELISATNGTFTSYYNYDNEGNRTRKVVVKGNITETRYYIGGYEVYRKFVNNTLNLERTSLSIYDIKISQKELPKKNENDKSVMVTNYEIDTYNRIVLIETKTVENGQPVLTPVTNIRYQYSNHLGSACLELDELGAIISYEEYHPFGTTSYRSGRTEIEVSLKRYKYCGKEKDEETGLYYYGARFYAPWICRFTAVDPLQNKYPEISPYAYCNNNPIKFIDPNGEEIWIIGENGSRTVYTQGMKYEGTDKGVAAKIDTLNQMNLTESGNSLLSNLIGSENTWSIIDHQESGPDNPHVCANDPIKGNSGGQIVTQGFNELSTLSHELFHAYQYEMGQGGGNIPNEIEARLFTSFVSYELTGEGDWRDLFPMGTNASPDYSSSLGAFMRMEEMTETEFNTNFQNLVSGFKTGALSGEYYSNFRENRRNNQINLFKGFYPNIKP